MILNGKWRSEEEAQQYYRRFDSETWNDEDMDAETKEWRRAVMFEYLFIEEDEPEDYWREKLTQREKRLVGVWERYAKHSILGLQGVGTDVGHDDIEKFERYLDEKEKSQALAKAKLKQIFKGQLSEMGLYDENNVQQKYPVGPGWWPLLDQSIPQIESLGVRVHEIGEYRGALKLHIEPISCDWDLWFENKNFDKVADFIDEVYCKSTETCEVCGGEGHEAKHSLDGSVVWVATLCNKHAEQWTNERCYLLSRLTP